MTDRPIVEVNIEIKNTGKVIKFKNWDQNYIFEPMTAGNDFNDKQKMTDKQIWSRKKYWWARGSRYHCKPTSSSEARCQEGLNQQTASRKAIALRNVFQQTTSCEARGSRSLELSEEPKKSW